MALSTVRKAILAFLIPFIGALGAALQDGNLTLQEFLTSLGFGLVTGVAVHQVRNDQ